MINHIVLWNLKEELSENERKAAASEIKLRLESIKSQVTGVISLELVINEAKSSNKDIALLSKLSGTSCSYRSR